MSFKHRLKLLRVQRNLTQQELAAGIGVANSTISMYERGEREPDLETLETIADYFNVDMNYLTDRAPMESAGNGGLSDSKPDTIKSAPDKDAELQAYLEELRTRPEQRAMFSLTKGATKEDVEAAVAIVDAYMKSRGLMKDDE